MDGSSRRAHLWRRRLGGWLGLSGVVGLAIACGAGKAFPGPPPVAALASSPDSRAAFERLREAWGDRRQPAAALRAQVERFLARYPRDGLAPLARVFLGLVAMKQGDLLAADAALAATRDVPAGVTHDFWTIARAKRLRLGGDSEAAIAILRPDVGKEVDPLARSLFQEELTLTALATHRDYEAVSYMDAWLRASSDEDRDDTIDRVSALVEKLSKEVLIGALQAMRAQRASLGYGPDIERILSERLVHIATASGDAELARLLLDADAGAILATGDAGAALGELATSRRGLTVVEGHTVGLLLPTGSAALRDESAGILRGAMWALGLPHGVPRTDPAAATADAAPSGPLTPCAALADAAPLDPPTDAEGMRLVTRQDAGDGDGVEGSLDELAGEGATVIIAGLDSVTAALALRWSEERGVAVVALVPSANRAAPGAFGFEVGEPRAQVLAALGRAVPGLVRDAIVTVVDASELSAPAAPSFPDGGTPATWPETQVSCDIAALHAGETRFPVADWARHKVDAWLVSGSAGCASDLVGELTQARARGVVALTLEASAWPTHARSLRVVAAQAGILPAAAHGDPRAPDARAFAAASGGLDWWAALGRDAGTLARIAVRDLPRDATGDLPSVRDRRSRARDALAAAHTRLWTTDGAGWSSAHELPRPVCAVDVTARSD